MTSYCKVLPLIFIHHTVELDNFLSLFHRCSKEDRERQSLVTCVYLYPHVRWVKKKNSINKVKHYLTEIPPKVSIDITIYRYSDCRAGRYGPKNYHDNYFHISRYR